MHFVFYFRTDRPGRLRERIMMKGMHPTLAKALAPFAPPASARGNENFLRLPFDVELRDGSLVEAHPRDVAVVFDTIIDEHMEEIVAKLTTMTHERIDRDSVETAIDRYSI